MAQPARKGTRLPDYRWADYDDDALLKLRLSSLGLRLKNSLVWADVERLWSELERKIMGKGEDGSRKWRMRILRHETGHAIDNAYALRRRADWRKVFGRGSAPYPRSLEFLHR